jgi:hypothetical protein
MFIITTINQQHCTLDYFLIPGTTLENGYMENKDDDDIHGTQM